MKNTSFLDYYKTILQKVSFDPDLLLKEYRKALNALHPSEIEEFEQWISSVGLLDQLNEAIAPASMAEVG